MTDAASSDDALTPPTFDSLPLSDETRAALAKMGYLHPTPVQRAVLEPASRGRDLVVQARTGTGKTTAFGLPIIDSVVKKSVKAVQVLCLCPTRELALQVASELERLGEGKQIQPVAIYGGAPMGRQIEALSSGAQVVVGTPGRVLDHLRRGTFKPASVKSLILDEADEMLSMGFERELSAILDLLPKDRQTLLFSATMPPDIERMARERLRQPEFITLSSDAVGAQSISHFVYFVLSDKISALLKIIETENPESAIIFCNMKVDTEAVSQALSRAGYDADWLNGDLPQNEREEVIGRIRQSKLRFLVATDVAARGIDISHLTHVINYDFPDGTEAYVHRTGRTGRAGKTGTAISLVRPQDIGNLYLLRLTYNIKPFERSLPTAGELKTRREADLVQMLVEAYLPRTTHADDIQLARRLLSHDRAEVIVANLLRERLGDRLESEEQSAAARRAKNPPIPVTPTAAPEGGAPRAPREFRERSDRGDRGGRSDRGGRNDRGGRDSRDSRGRDEGRGFRDEPRREVRPGGRDLAPGSVTDVAAATPPAAEPQAPRPEAAPVQVITSAPSAPIDEPVVSAEVQVEAAVEQAAVPAAAPAITSPAAPAPATTVEAIRDERRAPPARDNDRRHDRGERSFEAPRAERAPEAPRERSFEAPRAERAPEAPRAERAERAPEAPRAERSSEAPRAERPEAPRGERPGTGAGRPEGRRQRGAGYRGRPEGEDEPIRYSVSDAEPIRYSVSDAEPRGPESSVRPGSNPERMERPSDLVNWHPAEEEGDDRPIFVPPGGGSTRRRRDPSPVATSPLPPPVVVAPPPEARRSEGSEEPLFAEDREGGEDGEGYATVYVDIGRREGARPADLQRVLRDRGNITRRETGRIRMRDRYALVSVRRELLTRAIEALSGAEIGGKVLKAEPAREREAEGD